MTISDAQAKINERIAGDCLHILKDFARMEKEHKSRIAKACLRVGIELDARDQAFAQLVARIDVLVSKGE